MLAPKGALLSDFNQFNLEKKEIYINSWWDINVGRTLYEAHWVATSAQWNQSVEHSQKHVRCHMDQYFPLPFNAIIITQLSTIPTVLVQITTSCLELQSLAMSSVMQLNLISDTDALHIWFGAIFKKPYSSPIVQYWNGIVKLHSNCSCKVGCG